MQLAGQMGGQSSHRDYPEPINVMGMLTCRSRLCLCHAAGWTDGGYDAIPTAADPNGGLTKRTTGDEDAVVPGLQKRAGFANANAKQIQTIKDLIAMWDLPGLAATGKQVSLCSMPDAVDMSLCTSLVVKLGPYRI